MSTFNLDFYTDRLASDPQPQWMKCERLDFCEPYDGEKSGKKRFALIQMIVSLFA